MSKCLFVKKDEENEAKIYACSQNELFIFINIICLRIFLSPINKTIFKIMFLILKSSFVCMAFKTFSCQISS